MVRFSSALLCFSCLSSVVCAPTTQADKEDLVFAREFMSRFGYLDSEADNSHSESLVKAELALKDVQRFGGLPQTGRLDNSTLTLMKSPRCGLPDIVASKRSRRFHPTHSQGRGGGQRHKRYILASGMGWLKRHLTYFIANWSPKLGGGPDGVRGELKRALSAWAKYGHLRFTETSSPEADIIVAFGHGDHGDGYPFDGPGLTLAHAFFPGEQDTLGGDIHFDDDEDWKINPGELEDGVDFFSVAVHEIGHSLGLSHSAAQESVMNPYYKRAHSQTFSLGYDDVLAMYELYIKNSNKEGNDYDKDDENDDKKRQTTTTTTNKPTTTIRPQVTYEGDDESVDDHKRHDPTHRIPSPSEPLTPPPPPRPRQTPPPDPTNSVPNACEGHFNAVSYLRGELFIFKNNLMWRLVGPGRVASGYPVPTRRMFHKLPQVMERIDAAYERDTDSNIVFFSGDQFWVYNGNDVVEGPRPLSDYGLPSYVRHVDAVMVWARNRKTYIFSGDQFWRFNESSRSMDPGYPRPMSLFKGVPTNLDSAMTWSDGITYFFKNNFFWAFNNNRLITEHSYPLGAAQHWMGCNIARHHHSMLPLTQPERSDIFLQKQSVLGFQQHLSESGTVLPTASCAALASLSFTITFILATVILTLFL